MAQCTASGGGVETCTGNLSGAGTAVFVNPTPAINDLEVNTVTTGPSQIVLSGVGVSVGNGNGAAPGSYACSNSGDCTINNGVSPPTCSVNAGAPGGTTCVPNPASYTCSASGDCTIDNSTTPPTCSVNTGAPSGTKCVAQSATPAQSGPSGKSGPQVIVNVVAPTAVTVGVGRIGVAVIGYSAGSNGGGGGSGGVAGNGGDGGPGVDGGPVSVKFTGVIANGNYGGILAQSVGGNGGSGGNGGTLGGSGGSGGVGGFGGTAAASFLGGSITTTGDNGITAISQGGNGGSGGGGGFFIPAAAAEIMPVKPVQPRSTPPSAPPL